MGLDRAASTTAADFATMAYAEGCAFSVPPGHSVPITTPYAPGEIALSWTIEREDDGWRSELMAGLLAG